MRWCTLTPRLWPGNDRPFAMLAAQTAPGCERNCARPLPSSTAHTRLLSRVTDPPVQLPPPIRQPECKTTFQCLQTIRGNLLRLHTQITFQGRSLVNITYKMPRTIRCSLVLKVARNKSHLFSANAHSMPAGSLSMG